MPADRHLKEPGHLLGLLASLVRPRLFELTQRARVVAGGATEQRVEPDRYAGQGRARGPVVDFVDFVDFVDLVDVSPQLRPL